MEKKVFCEECRTDVNFSVKETLKKGKIKGELYSYNGKTAYCKNCKNEIYVPSINDFNLNALYSVYRKKQNIISLEDIRAINPKYNIGKRPLSLLLGWGEQTFSRYYDGDIPTKQYSAILQKIYNDPAFYMKLLEANKNNLKTAVSYEKSKKATSLLIKDFQNNTEKIDLVIEYLLNRCGDITPLALQKTLYYIQGFYYAFHHTFLFSEECEAWIHGPVYRKIYSRYKNYQFDPIKKPNEFNTETFTATEKAIFDSVIKNLCCYSGKILEQFTHSETPWISARKNISPTAASNQIIEKKLIGTYFSKIKTKYNMINPNDIGDYTKAMFSRI
ncbi:type II toxin-antitoxin system antitoxin SocA domain-containing protein [Pectinatus sottacetonis]|uniref:type II toxin-antitoxin system antitoxin SocA domain-containing protein n=1 Tax=Pectinatus sottacetonis TaxID=1002795 RepID=UPI0018C859C4